MAMHQTCVALQTSHVTLVLLPCGHSLRKPQLDKAQAFGHVPSQLLTAGLSHVLAVF